MVASIFYLASLFYSDSFKFTILLVGILTVVQGYYLYLFLERANREVIGFFESVKWDDFSHSYPEKKSKSYLDGLYFEFNSVIKKFREVRAENEAHYQYLKTIVQHVGIGIITFEKGGEVQMVNTAAKRILGLSHLKHIRQLKEINPTIVEAFLNLRTGGRDLIKIGKDEDEIQVAVYAIELSLRGKEFKLISIQNIQSELEEKEMEAWQNLIRVLTHEIMNSVTPISSLARTIEAEMEDWLKSGQDMASISSEQIEDFYQALSTIHRRSDSLIKFVSDFRNMTRITLPKFSEVCVQDLIKHMVTLHRQEITNQQIEVEVDIPEKLCIQVDEQQIEQVLINLIKNAIEALHENDEFGKSKKLWIKAIERPEGGAIITIRDNGHGIDEEAIRKIFIPFFTTKKSGSGIGLSLSKQIIRNHGGTISVKSIPNEGTEFTLKFQG